MKQSEHNSEYYDQLEKDDIIEELMSLSDRQFKIIDAMEEKLKKLNKIIYDFENSTFKVMVDEDCTIIENSNKIPAIESTIINSKNIAEGDIFVGKDVKFKIKHPNTYY